MTDIAFAIDMALYALFFVTVCLIAYKTAELAMPHRFGHDLTVDTHEEADLVMERLEAWLALLAVIASTAAFVGLAGTVAHIMTALSNIKGSALDITVISGPIATSLKATLLGLASAIPAAVSHQLLQRRLTVLDGRLRRQLPSEA